MARRRVKLVKFSKSEMEYDIPPNLSGKRLRREGRGLAIVKRLVDRSRRTVVLEPDVYKYFRTARKVNQALRLVKKIHSARSKDKKSA